MHPSDHAPHLNARTWETAGGGILFVPVGSTEQHGPHLPLSTDTAIADAVAQELAARFLASGAEAAAAAPVSFGASGEHEGFAGTISIGTAVLTEVLIEIGRSASRWARAIVFVNGHGGNVDALRSAVERLNYEGRDATWVACAAVVPEREPDAHAGRVETSLMLHLAGDDVRLDRAMAGDVRPLRELLPDLRRHGVKGVSPNGVLGDPAGASAAEGRALFEAMCDAAWDRVRGAVAAAAAEHGSPGEPA